MVKGRTAEYTGWPRVKFIYHSGVVVTGLGMRNIIKRRVYILLASIITLLVLSPVGYMFIQTQYEDENGEPNPIEAFFWTVATITTMGAPEDVSLSSPEGMIYTIVVVFFGIALFFIGFPFFIIGPWLEEQVKKATTPEHIPLPEEDQVVLQALRNVAASLNLV